MTDVLGIDPSLTGTGIAHETGQLTVSTDSSQADGPRLTAIYSAVTDHIGLAVRLAVIEDLPTHAKGAGRTGMAQGVVRFALDQLDVPTVIVTAATLKKFATGNGNANKGDMRLELYKRAGIDVRDDNQVDAWWLRAIGKHLLSEPLVELPKTHTSALNALATQVQQLHLALPERTQS